MSFIQGVSKAKGGTVAKKSQYQAYSKSKAKNYAGQSRAKAARALRMRGK
jgi:hypothetical protein